MIFFFLLRCMESFKLAIFKINKLCLTFIEYLLCDKLCSECIIWKTLFNTHNFEMDTISVFTFNIEGKSHSR